jgi:murein DD-endopeptidase MepM/ murein hydrolase activator NlpD
MAGTPPTPATPSTATTDAIKTKLARISASTAPNAKSDLNTQPPTPQYNQYGQRIFETAPTQLATPFGSPLTKSGPFAIGPNQERQIAQSWSPPNVTGLVFNANYGESVLSCGDGVVTFVGWQSPPATPNSQPGGNAFEGASESPDGSIVDVNGNFVASATQVGPGGVYVTVQMNGNFTGYTCQYFNLSNIKVSLNDTVSQGQVLGSAGNSGNVGRPPSLLLQVIYVSGNQRVLVNPTSIVPNRNIGGPDSTNTTGGSPTTMPASAPAGVQYQASQAANVISAWDRSTFMQNLSLGNMRQAIANYTKFITSVVSVPQTALDSAVASFNKTPAQVATPMTFNFSTGTWTDNNNPV